MASLTPEEVPAAARATAADRLAGDAYAADAARLVELGASRRTPLARLHEWAFVEVDPSVVYSTRKLGGPITAVKRLLLRATRQYNNELTAQVARYNVQLLGYIRGLELRLARLEEELAEREERDGHPPAGA